MRRHRAFLVVVPFLLWSSCSEPSGPVQENGPADPTAATTASSGPRLVINEVMADPDAVADAGGEWLEVHNWGSSPVDLDGWALRSGNDSPHLIAGSVVVPAGGYAVLARSDRKKENGNITVDHVYGTAIQLANGGDWVALENAAGTLVDSVAWSSVPTGASRGVQDPSQEHTSMDGANWSTATSSYGRGKEKDLGTPGAQNDGYIEPLPEVDSVEVSPASDTLAVGDTAQLTATAYDEGGEPVETAFTWSSSDTAVATVSTSGLVTAVAEGNAQLLATAENGVTGSASVAVTAADTGSAPGSGMVVINEVMPNPAAVPDADGEWFELHNPGSEAIELEGWTVASNNDSPHVIDGPLVVPAGGYAVLARSGDSAVNGGLSVDYTYGSGMTLANSSDWLAVRDGSGATIDSVTWSSMPTGATRGVSDPTADNTDVNGSNWHTASSTYGAGDQGTPGAPNDGYVPPDGGDAVVAEVDVLPATASVAAGQTQPFTAEAQDSAGDPVSAHFTWSSSDTAVATVDGDGLASALAAGTAVIRATAENGVYGEATLTVTAPDTTVGDSALRVKVLDIGQGDATYIENGGSRIFIDGGPSRTAFGAHLDALGLNDDTIDVVIISHAHFDHYSGLRELFETERGITVRYLFENQDPSTAVSLGELRDSIHARVGRGELIYRDTDDPCVDGSPTCTIQLAGGARMHILRPDPNGGSANNRSAAVKLVGPDSASFTMWFAGDAEHDEIDWFETGAAYHLDPGMDVDVLKGDHHGSCNGLTRRYIEILSPDWVTMSLSSSNSYGHVHEQTKTLLTELGVPWYRTDENGTVTFESPGTAGGGYTVSVERSGVSLDGVGDGSSAASECQDL